jgi:zinc/manganese transport system substrate-binding protein
MRFLFSLLLSVATQLALAAGPTAHVPVVVTANTILDDLVRQVGGDQVSTSCLVTPGADPHTFDPRPSDVKQLLAADLLVVNGLDLEPAVLKLATGAGFRGQLVVATAGIQPRTGGCAHAHHEETDEHDHLHLGTPSASSASSDQSQIGNPKSEISAPDPHAWQNPLLVATYVANIRDALIRANPAAAELYLTRAAAYIEQLAALDRWAREQIATLPPARRKLVTSHDSLGYFADAYGFETVPVAGISSSAEPDARTVAGIVDLIRDEQVPAVFLELTTNPKLLRQIGADAGVRLAEPLFTDSVGPAGSGAETYLDLIRTNVTRIVAALR